MKNNNYIWIIVVILALIFIVPNFTKKEADIDDIKTILNEVYDNIPEAVWFDEIDDNNINIFGYKDIVKVYLDNRCVELNTSNVQTICRRGYSITFRNYTSNPSLNRKVMEMKQLLR